MKRLMFEGLYSWSVFDEEKQFDFNGHLWVRPEGNVLIDPVPMGASDRAQLAALGGATTIVLTNRDHDREAVEFKEQLGAQLVTHVAEAPHFEFPIDRTVADGEEIVSDLRVLHLEHGKSPGEIALIWLGGQVAFIGDFVWGSPAGELSLGAPQKVSNHAQALLQLRKLLAIRPLDALLLGDGHSIYTGAREALLMLLESRSDIYINRINLDEVNWETRPGPGPYRLESKDIDSLIGARRLGYQLVRLAPGRATYPRHFHHVAEEMFYVTDGTCTLLTDRGEFAVRAGDFIAAPSGPSSAHKFVNNGTAPCTILMLGTVPTVDNVEYPDSGKVNVGAVRRLFRLKDAVDYFDGEA
ncbi:MAG: cupin domain-containing protein [Chloroflexota bacterium]|nr:cupin domain-containing protein [Chloroflexota bacterium]